MVCNLHWCFTFCSDVTIFALLLHFNCTAVSQSMSSNVFHMTKILMQKKKTALLSTTHRKYHLVCCILGSLIKFKGRELRLFQRASMLCAKTVRICSCRTLFCCTVEVGILFERPVEMKNEVTWENGFHIGDANTKIVP